MPSFSFTQVVSDHYGVILQLRTRKVRYNRNATRRKVWSYDLADFTGACNQLDDLQLEDLLVPIDINQSLLNWCELFLRTMHQFIPHADDMYSCFRVSVLLCW